jgi:hypothetical protein
VSTHIGELADMALVILETAVQVECARLLAEHFPHASKQQISAMIDQCERDLPQMGFNENLGQLRKELAIVHPSWR